MLQFQPLVEILTSLPTFIPMYGTPKTIELLSVLGPLYSRLSLFPDNAPQIATKYFGSDNPLVYATELSHSMRGFPVGSRNPGDVTSCISSLRQSQSLIIVILTLNNLS